MHLWMKINWKDIGFEKLLFLWFCKDFGKRKFTINFECIENDIVLYLASIKFTQFSKHDCNHYFKDKYWKIMLAGT